MAKASTKGNGKGPRESKGHPARQKVPDIMEAAELVAKLRADCDRWQQMALKRDTVSRLATLREGLFAWAAQVVQELQAVDSELRDQGAELWAALTSDEKIELSKALECAWSVLLDGLPRRVPTFLAPLVTLPLPGAKS